MRKKPSKVQVNRRASVDDQTSTTLNPSVIAAGFANDGQGTDPIPGEYFGVSLVYFSHLFIVEGLTASLTSSNNFINFCATLNIPLTNGTQITSESCNSAPMGALPSEDNIVSCLFIRRSYSYQFCSLPYDSPFLPSTPPFQSTPRLT